MLSKKTKPKHKPRVIIVSADEFINDIYRKKLSAEKIDFKGISHADKDFIEKIFKTKPDLILMGIVFPDANGFKLVETLKKDQRTKAIPIIGFSNLSEKENAGKCLDLGMDGYWNMTEFSPEEICGKIVDFLQKQSMFRKKIIYETLNPKQKEIHNFQKASSIFADYGYTTIKLSDDWMGADFIAISFDGLQYLRVQLKTALTFDEKYKGKDLYICFFERKGDEIKNLYLYPHDELLEKFMVKFGKTVSWKRDGRWFWGSVPKHAREVLEPYLIK